MASEHCPRPLCTVLAVRRSRCRRRCHRPARRCRRAGFGARSAWRLDLGRRRVAVSATWRARCQLMRAARCRGWRPSRPRAYASRTPHAVPAASRCSAISAAFSSARSSVRSRRPGAGAVWRARFQLRLVGHRSDQRVTERVLGARGVRHPIDQLRLQQLGDTSDPSVHRVGGSSSGLNRAPMTAAAFRSCLAGLLSRSTRAAMVACSVAGTPMSAASSRRGRHRDRRRAHRVRPDHAPSPRRRTGSRRPVRRSGRERAHRRVSAQQLGGQRRGLGAFSGAREWSGAGVRDSAPRYSGR